MQETRKLRISVRDVERTAVNERADHVPQGRQRQVDLVRLLKPMKTTHNEETKTRVTCSAQGGAVAIEATLASRRTNYPCVAGK